MKIFVIGAGDVGSAVVESLHAAHDLTVVDTDDRPRRRPDGSFEPFSDVSKLIPTALMFLGRLEIIPIALLLTRTYWRR